MGGSFQSFSDLMADDLVKPASNNDLDEVYRHNVLFFNSTVGNTYAAPYASVFRANRVLEVVDNFDFSETESNRIKGECLFLRALAHFEVVKLFAHSYGYSSNNDHLGIVIKSSPLRQILPRSTVNEVYLFVIKDLQDAANMLPDNNAIYATSDAARALLAKVYFQMGDYANAAQMASEVINSGNYSLGTSVDRYLSDNVSPETIFWLDSYLDLSGGTAFFASGNFTGNYRYSQSNLNPVLKPTRAFYDIYAGDTTDKRLAFFEVINPGESKEAVVCKKFDRDYFNVPLLHLTDLKLLRAEALAEQGLDLATAISDVNDIRERAYGSTAKNLNAGASANTIIEAARYERRIEMFGEGDRFDQLKRRGAIENENIAVRGDAWDCNGMILQFPISENTDVFEMNPTGGCN
ncbi:MAG: RagB/SusD family nutrient uptake outer membrane protein, partial [Owenweeksia sp.]